MLQVNEDINDELFRRAAENYPLKTDNPDWDAVLNKMNNAGSAGEPEHGPVSKKRNKNYRFLLLLLLLIPLAIFENKRSKETELLSGKNTSSASASLVKNESGENIPVKETTGRNIPAAGKAGITIQPETKKSAGAVVAQTDIKNNHTPAVITAVNGNNPVTAGSNRYSSKQRSKVKIINAQPATGDENNDGSAVARENRKKKKIQAAASIAIKNADEENTVVVKKEAGSEEKVVATEPEKSTAVITTIITQKTDSLNKTITTKTAEKDIAKTNDKNVSREKKKNKEHTKHFYAGLLVAPDFSAVKMQSLKKVGLNYGFLAGYRLTKKISIEAGLLQDRKYYSTNGKYFSTKNIYLPPNATIEYVDGVCKMLELPVNISYTFSKKARSAWFGSVGVSSYFMQHESYVYNVDYSGYLYPKAYDYSNKSTSLFAMINISAGYTYKIGKIGDLRFEPYIKLPVNKIGTGDLPIQSAGIFIGFTKNIF